MFSDRGVPRTGLPAKVVGVLGPRILGWYRDRAEDLHKSWYAELSDFYCARRFLPIASKGGFIGLGIGTSTGESGRMGSLL